MTRTATLLATLLAAAAATTASSNCTLSASGGDDTPAIEKAFRSCTEVLIPEDQNLLIGTALNTTGLVRTKVRLLGTMTIKDDIDYWRDNAFNVSYQFNSAAWMFGGDDVILDGEGIGTIDGNGQTFYDARIANDSLRPPHLFLAYKANHMVIRNLNVKQSPRWTFLIHSSQNVIFHDLNIRSRSNTWALGRESNRETDGVDIYDSKFVMLHNLNISNGDDCVSFKPNATNIFVADIACNGSHGVSVGSLGEYEGVKDVVSNIYVNNVTIKNAENGPRIKTWSGEGRGYGYVDQVVFANFVHDNNDSPLTIDNCYKGTEDQCTAYPSEMTISNVWFTNQNGTSSGKYGNVATTLVCSIGKCSNVFLDNVDIDVPSACGDTVYANRHLNVQGNSAYKFSMDAETYGAGGINPDNTTVSGVTCSNGQVIVTNTTTTADS